MTRPTIDMAAIAASPYTMALLLSAMVARLLSICRIRLGKPTCRIRTNSRESCVTVRREMRLMVLRVRNIYRRIPKLTACDMAVESPAPSIPSPRPNIRTGSPSMFRTPPATSPTMAKTAFPSYLRTLFNTQLAISRGPESRI